MFWHWLACDGLMGFSFAVGLVFVGMVLTTAPFMGSNAAPTQHGVYLGGDVARNEPEQGIERATSATICFWSTL